MRMPAPRVVHAYPGPRPNLVIGMLVALSWVGVLFAIRSTMPPEASPRPIGAAPAPRL